MPETQSNSLQQQPIQALQKTPEKDESQRLLHSRCGKKHVILAS